MNPQDIVICSRPSKLTVGDVRRLLVQKDAVAKRHLADLILHRLCGRYLTPLEHVPAKPVDYKSGFLMMAAACLLIESFQCFKDGKKDTKARGQGLQAFKKFFSDYSSEFRGLDGEVFYYNIRCGILHQAQTQGRFRILRSGAIFENNEKSINATKFLRTLRRIVDDYVRDLSKQELSSVSWKNPLKKIEYICEAIETE